LILSDERINKQVNPVRCLLSNRVNIILEKAVIIDAHFDLLFDVVKQRGYGRKKIIETDHLPNFIEGGVNIVVSSIFIDNEFLPEMALRKALSQVSALYAEIDESPNKIMLCKSYEDINKAKNEGKVGILLSFEGVEPLYNDLSLLRIFYELGVRIVGLTWSRRNYAGDGCHFSPVREGKKGGITDFGVQLIEKAEDLGMFIDVSHLNDEGFWDVMEIAKNPVIASHSNCRALVDTKRNLTDKQIKAIASKNGVIGMNVDSVFTANDDKKANVESLINHVDHIAKLVGVKYVGVGFDFCDRLRQYEPQRTSNSTSRKPFDVLKGHKKINKFVQALIERGYKDEEIELILGENFMRVYKEILK